MTSHHPFETAPNVPLVALMAVRVPHLHGGSLLRG